MEEPNFPTTRALPSEIWTECFAHLSMAEHKRLTQTCHFFHDICLSFIFKSITYRSKLLCEYDSFPSQLEQLYQQMEWFNRIALNPQRACLVRKCTLVYSFYLGPNIQPDRAEGAKLANNVFLEALLRALPLFINLKEFHVNFHNIMDMVILAALAVHPNLKLVSFPQVEFGIHHLSPRLKLQKLLLGNPREDLRDGNNSENFLDLFSAPHLELVEVMSRTYSHKLFRALAMQGASHNLLYLSFEFKLDDIDVLYTFLATCPNLRYINWDLRHGRPSGPDDVPHVPPLLQSTIPRLQAYQGGSAAAGAWIPGRPVWKAVVHGTWDKSTVVEMQDIFQKMSLSTGPVTDLELSTFAFPEVFEPISTHFPELKRLHLGFASHGLFPEQDPRDIALGTDGKVSLRVPEPEPATPLVVEELLPRYTHWIYMTILHWIAHQKCSLPLQIEELYLCTTLFVPSNEKEERVFRYAGRSYPLRVVHSIFATLSILYPALQSVVVGSKFHHEIHWCKNTSNGTWTSSGVREGRYKGQPKSIYSDFYDSQKS
ncbi:hypothetical protein GALMADRAFT_230833 [Galerina marginata CBS 339.88]|uniref:F-box domain-containing protein n=1 Tax=Galerina marginata (strain CBS 339.88) TaxID=685588 RepID=A0A067SNT7_GALM3|nr:hypothetical protein GALMADRAFT_230833 [Galerina marginata CBS 339.88]